MKCDRCQGVGPAGPELPLGWSVVRVTRAEATKRKTVRPRRWLPRTLCPGCSTTVLSHLHGRGF
jgi:hypothetical protein